MIELGLRLLGRSISGRLSSAPAGIVKELFDHPELAESSQSRWHILISEHQGPPPAEALEGAYRAEIHQGFVMIKPGPAGVWISSSDHAVYLRTNAEMAHLELYTQAMRDGGALMVGLIEALRESGLIPLHASIATRDNAGTAFLGMSGRGKTTTLISALRLGYTPVCEDFALLDPETLTVYGLDQGLRCLPDTLERLQAAFPEVQPSAFVRGKHFVPFERFAKRQHQTQLCRMLLLERHPDEDSRLEPLPASERVMALFSASGVPLLAGGRALTTASFKRLASHLEISRLYLGKTPLPI